MKKNNLLKILAAFILVLGLWSNVYGAEIKGDLDGDGEVTAYDAFLSLQVAQESEEAIEITEENFEIIDINSDEEITEEDTKLILEYSVDIIEDPSMWKTEEEEKINRYYYDQLSEKGKIVYDGIMNDIDYVQRSNSAFINLGSELNGTPKEVYQEVQYALEYDNPEMFYFSNLGIVSNIQVYDKATKTTTYSSGVTVRKTEVAKTMDVEAELQKMEAVKNKVVQSVNGMSDYDKIKTIHDYVIDNTTYVKGAPNEQNAYGCLIEKQAVCNGYAKAFKYLCNAAGIECEMIVSETHAWNAVYLEGAWYYVDTTWDDNKTSRYKYFLKGTDSFNDASHKQQKLQNLIYPNVSKTAYSK